MSLYPETAWEIRAAQRLIPKTYIKKMINEIYYTIHLSLFNLPMTFSRSKQYNN